MPVSETLWLKDALAGEELPLDAVVVNAAYPSRFASHELEELRSALGRTRSPLARSALRAAMSEHARAGIQHEQQDRLREQLDVPLAVLPYLFAQQLGSEELQALADELDARLLGGSAERTVVAHPPQ